MIFKSSMYIILTIRPHDTNILMAVTPTPNLFELKEIPGVGFCDARSPELKRLLIELSAKILEIFGGNSVEAIVFIKRTVLQLRCKFAPCMFCGAMYHACSLMCLGCQRLIVMGPGVNGPPNKNKQLTYFSQFEIQIIRRAKLHVRRCIEAAAAKKIQALIRGWLVRATRSTIQATLDMVTLNLLTEEDLATLDTRPGGLPWLGQSFTPYQ